MNLNLFTLSRVYSYLTPVINLVSLAASIQITDSKYYALRETDRVTGMYQIRIHVLALPQLSQITILDDFHIVL